MRVPRWLRPSDEGERNEPVRRREFDDHLDKEASVRRRLDARIRAIEVEYDIRLEPVKVKEVI